jgi:MmyB-like transcription regulator ligand binding domain
LAALIADLGRSDEFAQLWTRHDVREKTHGTKRIAHPLVGEMTLEYETLRLPDPDQVLAVYTAEAAARRRRPWTCSAALAYSEAASSTK